MSEDVDTQRQFKVHQVKTFDELIDTMKKAQKAKPIFRVEANINKDGWLLVIWNV